MNNQIKVLIVDDSAVVRQIMSTILATDPAIRVLGVAADPIIAMEKMVIEWPDVILLDIEMPRMDGLTFLKKIMAERPTRVLICSTLTENGAETTMQALSAGAVGYLTKPKLALRDFLTESAQELIQSVKQAAQSTPRNFGQSSAKIAATAAPPGLNVVKTGLLETSDKVIAIGTSTGGTQALELLLTALPRVTTGIVIVQHMPAKFTAQFAERLNKICAIEVKEACTGDRVMIGRALIAPGGMHMRLARNGAYYIVEILNGPPVNCHKPSVDVLFKSVASVAGRNALGIIMTGMGDDGARGLRDMHAAGARTLAQDKETCVVFGMPKEAIKLGAVDAVLPLGLLPTEVIRYSQMS